jgi:hypothetical protein
MAYLDLGPYLVTGVVEGELGVLGVTAHRFQRAWQRQEATHDPLIGN